MGDWKRVTRECAVDGLGPEINAAIQKHLDLYNLGPLASQATACVETTSEKLKKGLPAGEKSVITEVILAPGWLIWIIRGERPDVTVMSANLADIVVQDYASTPFARMVPDTGVEVSGTFTDVAERGSSFIPLDDGPAAQRFKKALMDAVRLAKS